MAFISASASAASRAYVANNFSFLGNLPPQLDAFLEKTKDDLNDYKYIRAFVNKSVVTKDRGMIVFQVVYGDGDYEHYHWEPVKQDFYSGVPTGNGVTRDFVADYEEKNSIVNDIVQANEARRNAKPEDEVYWFKKLSAYGAQLVAVSKRIDQRSAMFDIYMGSGVPGNWLPAN